MCRNSGLKLNGNTASAAVVGPAPVWTSFDLLGAGSTTIFTRSSPAVDTDPTHVASATLPAGGANTNQQADDNSCAATRQSRLNVDGSLEYFVTLRGRVIKTGGAANTYVLFTIQTGYRPLRKHHFSSQQDFGSSMCHFNINNLGECRMSGGSVLCLDGVSFWTN